MSFTVWRDSAACFLSLIVILIPIDGVGGCGRQRNRGRRCDQVRGEADRNRKEMTAWAFAETKSRYRDLEVLVDYREYDGAWTQWFEENWLKPRLKALGYTHVRFFGGKTCEYDGSFRERVCELGMPGSVSADSSCTGEGRGPSTDDVIAVRFQQFK